MATAKKTVPFTGLGFDDLLANLKHSNFEPYVKDSISNQEVLVGHSYAFQIPVNTFFDDDGNNTLTYTAMLSDGNVLPAWLRFDAKKKTFSGTPKKTGTYNIKVMATDTANSQANCIFSIRVN